VHPFAPLARGDEEARLRRGRASTSCGTWGGAAGRWCFEPVIRAPRARGVRIMRCSELCGSGAGSSPADLRVLADEELMQPGSARQAAPGVRGCSTTATPTMAFLPLAYRICGAAGAASPRTSCRRRWPVRCGAAGARYDPRARGACARGSWESSTTARSTRCAGAQRARTAGSSTRRASRIAWKRRERTDVEAARRDEAREIRDALEQLPDEQSRVIELAYFRAG